MSFEWKRAGRLMALVVMAVALTACGGSEDADSGGGSGGSGGSSGSGGSGDAAATAGPDEATKNAAVRDAEQKLAALRQTAGELRKRAEIDGVADDGAVQQSLSALDRQIADVQSKIAAMKSASGEGWATAESSAQSTLSGADRAAGQLQSQIRSVRDAKRAESIEAEKPMLAKGLVMGLDGEEYESYKKAVIEQTQEQLTGLGLYDGPVDGWLEETTKRALTALQEQSGLGKSGIPTPKTRRVLRGENPFAEEDS